MLELPQAFGSINLGEVHIPGLNTNSGLSLRILPAYMLSVGVLHMHGQIYVCVLQTFASFISVGNYSDTSVSNVTIRVSNQAQ